MHVAFSFNCCMLSDWVQQDEPWNTHLYLLQQGINYALCIEQIYIIRVEIKNRSNRIKRKNYNVDHGRSGLFQPCAPNSRPTLCHQISSALFL